MPITEFPSGLRVETFEPPPPRFDPRNASDAELVHHGFPRRPTDNPQAMERYDAVLRRLEGKFHYITPTFTRHEDKQHRPLERTIIEGIEGQETFNNWSGVVQYASSGYSIRSVTGSWTIPNVYAPTQNQWCYCASWVGIDGDQTKDVCQAGVECKVFRSGSSTTRKVYAWFEWYPDNEFEITNFPVFPGDEVTCLIKTGGAGSTTASIFFTNESSGASTSFTIYAPTKTQLVGNCAEWIVERPGVSGALTQLADYGSVFFFNSSANDGSQTTGQVNNISMSGDSGKVISEGVLETPRIVQCLYVG